MVCQPLRMRHVTFSRYIHLEMEHTYGMSQLWILTFYITYVVMSHVKMKPKLICKEKYLDHFCLFQFILIKSRNLLYSLVSYIHLSLSLLQNLRLLLHLILRLITMQSHRIKYHHPQITLGEMGSVMSLIS